MVTRVFLIGVLALLVMGQIIGLPRPAAAFQVTLSGASNPEFDAALRAGSLLVERAEQEGRTPFEAVSDAQADYARLLGVLYAQGYFGAQVSIAIDGTEAAQMSALTRLPAIDRAAIRIVPGPAFVFGRVRLAPQVAPSDTDQTLQPGAPARIDILRAAAEQALGRWQDQGHAKARIAAQALSADHRTARLNADIKIAPGPVFRFGRLRPAGNSAVRSARIVEMAGLPQGALFTPDELDRAAQRLQRSGAFQSVVLEPRDPPRGAQLDVTAQITEAKPRRIGFGAELSGQDGLMISGYWLHRNLLGGAERLRLDGEIKGIAGDTGGEDYRALAVFERPATLNEDTNFYANADLEHRNEASFTARQITLETGFERIATPRRRYRLGAAVRRGLIRSTSGESDYSLLLMPFGLTFDYKDRPLDAKTGYYAAIDLDPFAALGGGQGGLLARADLRAYHSFNGRLTAALRAQIGSLSGPSLTEAPDDFLFFSGGGGTVRGQSYQSLGVMQGGNLTGGRAFTALSAELRLRTSGKLGWVAFVDTGYVGPEAFPDGSGAWHSGAGVGLRYDTGLGPLRLDTAVPLGDGSGLHLYVGIGQAF